MSLGDCVTEKIAVEVARRNLEINVLIKQYESANCFEKLVLTHSVIRELIERMQGVDALLLVIGETPQYSPIIKQLLDKVKKMK